MSDNELLLAMSEMMDSKLEPTNKRFDLLESRLNNKIDQLDKKIDGVELRLNTRIDNVEDRLGGQIRTLGIIIENEIKPQIKLLVQSYVPAAERFEKASTDIEDMKSDIRMIKKVATEHSEKMQRIS